jgi:hypothetical protein
MIRIIAGGDNTEHAIGNFHRAVRSLPGFMLSMIRIQFIFPYGIIWFRVILSFSC